MIKGFKLNGAQFEPLQTCKTESLTAVVRLKFNNQHTYKPIVNFLTLTHCALALDI